MFKDKVAQERISHQKIDELYANPPQADPGAQYAKQLYLYVLSLCPAIWFSTDDFTVISLPSRRIFQALTQSRSRHHLVTLLRRISR
jgi:hypothetical protein